MTADGRIHCSVAPEKVPSASLLYSVNDVFNAVSVHGNMADSVMFYGRGAGSHATASAVVADVIEAALNRDRNVYAGWTGEKQALEDAGSFRCAFLVRVSGGDDAVPALSKLFGGGAPVALRYAKNEIGFVTPVMTEAEFEEKAAAAEGFISRIRIK